MRPRRRGNAERQEKFSLLSGDKVSKHARRNRAGRPPTLQPSSRPALPPRRKVSSQNPASARNVHIDRYQVWRDGGSTEHGKWVRSVGEPPTWGAKGSHLKSQENAKAGLDARVQATTHTSPARPSRACRCADRSRCPRESGPLQEPDSTFFSRPTAPYARTLM